MLAIIIILHPDAGGIGVAHAEERIVAELRRNCGGEIAVAAALAEMPTLNNVPDLAPRFNFAFCPTLFAKAACMRRGPTEFHVYVQAADLRESCTAAERASERVRKAFGEPTKVNITIHEDNGRDTPIKGQSFTFFARFLENAKERTVASLTTGGVGLLIAAIIFRNLGLATAIAVVLLFGYVIIVSGWECVSNKSGIKWNIPR